MFVNADVVRNSLTILNGPPLSEGNPPPPPADMAPRTGGGGGGGGQRRRSVMPLVGIAGFLGVLFALDTTIKPEPFSSLEDPRGLATDEPNQLQVIDEPKRRARRK